MYISEKIPAFIENKRSPKQFDSIENFFESDFFRGWRKAIKIKRFELHDMIDPTGHILENEYQLLLYDEKDETYNIASIYNCNKEGKLIISGKIQKTLNL